MKKRKMTDKMMAGIPVVILLVLILGGSAFAADPRIRAVTKNGYPVEFNENRYAVNAGDVFFRLDESRLGPGEIYVYEDGGIISPVENGVYVMEAKSSGDYGFVMFYVRAGDGLHPLTGGPFIVEFRDSVSVKPRLVFYEGDEETYPYLYASPGSWVQTFVRITEPGGKTTTYRITADQTKFVLSEDGTYSLEAYTMDGKGNRTYARELPETVLVDTEPPVVQVSKSETEGNLLKLHLEARDELSGIRNLAAELEGNEICRVSGGSADLKVELSKLSFGSSKLLIYAEDTAGNLSAGSITLTREDDEPPVIRFSGVSDAALYGEEVTVEVDITDNSGTVGRAETVIRVSDSEGRTVSERRTEERKITVSGSGEITMTAEAEDMAGNRSEKTIRFTVDQDAPEIIGLDETDGQTLPEFGLEKGGEELIRDLSYVNYYLTLNGLEYDGSRITRNGRYVLKVTAEDELGHRAVKSISFTIRNEEEKGLVREISANGISGNRGSRRITVSQNNRSAGREEMSGLQMVTVSFDRAESGETAAETPDPAETEGKLSGFFERIGYAIMKWFSKPFSLGDDDS